MPLERFVTTYSSDYKPFSERQPQVNPLNLRSEAIAPPAFIDPPQTNRETWPIFYKYFYKTTNSIYGSSACSESPACSLFPAFLPPFGTLAPPVSEVSRVVGCDLTEARTQEVGVARETGPLLDGEEKGQLRYVFGGKANVLEEQEAKDEQRVDVLYEEGVIVLSSHVGLVCCEDFLRSVCREAGLQPLLHLPVVSSSIITVKDAENWHNSTTLKTLMPAVGLKNNTLLQHLPCRQCSCFAWQTEYPNSCRFNMQTFPPGIPCGSTLPLTQVQLTACCTKPSGRPWLTEYQASYTAKHQNQQSDFHLCHPPHHQRRYPYL